MLQARFAGTGALRGDVGQGRGLGRYGARRCVASLVVVMVRGMLRGSWLPFGLGPAAQHGDYAVGDRSARDDLDELSTIHVR